MQHGTAVRRAWSGRLLTRGFAALLLVLLLVGGQAGYGGGSAEDVDDRDELGWLSDVGGPRRPAVAERSSDFETADFRDFDQANRKKGDLEIVRHGAGGSAHAAAASFAGGRGVGFARALWLVDWEPSTTVCFGGSFLLPPGFTDRIRGTVDVARWDNYTDDPVHTDHGGLTIWSDGGLRLLREQLGRNDYRVLLGPYHLPEGRWVRLVVTQVLRAGAPAVSAVFIDGRRRGTSTAANSYGRRATAIRYGVVAVDARRQDVGLGLRFDDVFYREGPCTADDL